MTLAQSLIVYFISPVLSLLVFLIFASIVMSWLVGFGVISLRNPTAAQIHQILRNITEPILAPFRSILPPISGMDFSPVLALLLIGWINSYIIRDVLFRALG